MTYLRKNKSLGRDMEVFEVLMLTLRSTTVKNDNTLHTPCDMWNCKSKRQCFSGCCGHGLPLIVCQEPLPIVGTMKRVLGLTVGYHVKPIACWVYRSIWEKQGMKWKAFPWGIHPSPCHWLAWECGQALLPGCVSMSWCLGCVFKVPIISEIPVINNRRTFIGKLNLCLLSIPDSIY